MGFYGTGRGDMFPDANTLQAVPEALIAARELEEAFELMDQTISATENLPMGGQSIDVALVAAPKQHNAAGERAAMQSGAIPEEWKDQPARPR